MKRERKAKKLNVEMFDVIKAMQQQGLCDKTIARKMKGFGLRCNYKWRFIHKLRSFSSWEEYKLYLSTKKMPEQMSVHYKSKTKVTKELEDEVLKLRNENWGKTSKHQMHRNIVETLKTKGYDTCTNTVSRIIKRKSEQESEFPSQCSLASLTREQLLGLFKNKIIETDSKGNFIVTNK